DCRRCTTGCIGLEIHSRFTVRQGRPRLRLYRVHKGADGDRGRGRTGPQQYPGREINNV
ncbi:MAG: hypothetical protein AVDCRST_MAG43-1348, partial [uncultured Thermomicrobiales bacterium]